MRGKTGRQIMCQLRPGDSDLHNTHLNDEQNINVIKISGGTNHAGKSKM